jgi:hypothetical protein
LLDAETTPAPTRILALRKLQNVIQRDLVAGNHPALALERMSKLAGHSDSTLAIEAIRTMGWLTDANKFNALIAIAENKDLSGKLRVEATLQLSGEDEQCRAALVRLAGHKEPTVRQESLRMLADTELTDSERAALNQQTQQHAELAPLVQRVLDKDWRPERPKFESGEDWINCKISRTSPAQLIPLIGLIPFISFDKSKMSPLYLRRLWSSGLAPPTNDPSLASTRNETHLLFGASQPSPTTNLPSLPTFRNPSHESEGVCQQRPSGP